MKRILPILAFMAAALGFESPVQAKFVRGFQHYESSSTVSIDNDINDAVFTIHFEVLSGDAFGDFVGVFGSFNNVFDTTSTATLLAPTFEFGSPGYGTFAANSVNANALISNFGRLIVFTGTFTPTTTIDGGLFAPFLVPTTMQLAVTILVDQASPSTLSASATLAGRVPEPSSVILLGTFFAPVALGLWMRRKKR